MLNNIVYKWYLLFTVQLLLLNTYRVCDAFKKKTHSLEGTVTNDCLLSVIISGSHIPFFFAQIKWKQFRFAFVQMEALAHFCSCTAIIVQLNYPALCNFH